MYRKIGAVALSVIPLLALTAGCTLSLYSTPAVPPSPTVLIVPTLSVSPSAIPVIVNSPTVVSATAVPSAVLVQPTHPAPAQTVPLNFCADGQASGLINNFKNALQTSNGELLAALVSPRHGMDVRKYRYGTMVNYDPTHAKFLFESTYEVNWGAAPGSGLEAKGPFHEMILPDLLETFNKNFTLTCNRIQVGGASYSTVWPYAGINFYSVHFPGTAANGNLDWSTWLIGMEYVNSRPYLYALLPFRWEP